MSTKPLHFTVISDTHYYSKRLGTEGRAYELDNQKSQKLLAHAEEALRAAFAQIAKDDRSDIVLLSGDVVNNGEMASHEEAIALLRELQAAGKRVFVITSTHDYDEGSIYDGDQKRPVPSAKREDLKEMYFEFGPAQALAYHEESYSYVVQLADGYRLFALNDDRNGDGHSGFTKETFQWIKEQIEDAHEHGQMVIPMTHHPVIAPSPFYAMIGKGDMMGGHKEVRETLADWGVPFLFTGHTHIQDISFCVSEKGNVFYDVSTPSLVGYPGAFRHVIAEKDANMLAVSTEHITERVPSPDDETKDFDLRKAFEDQFFGMVRDVIAAAATSVPRFSEMARAFSVRPRQSLRFGWLLKPAAKWLTRLKIGRVAKWSKAESGLKPEDYAGIKDDAVVDFIISLVMHLFGGDAPYTPDTPQYKITIGLLNIIDSLLKIFGVKFKTRSLVEPLLYNAGVCDDGAVLDLSAPPMLPEFEETVRESRKGPWILCIAIALIIVLLPLLPLAALIIGIGFLINELRFWKQIRA